MFVLYEDPNPIEVGAVDAGVAGNVVNTIFTGYMQRFTKIKTVGLCHSVQVCSEQLLKDLGIYGRILYDPTSSKVDYECPLYIAAK